MFSSKTALYATASYIAGTSAACECHIWRSARRKNRPITTPFTSGQVSCEKTRWLNRCLMETDGAKIAIRQIRDLRLTIHGHWFPKLRFTVLDFWSSCSKVRLWTWLAIPPIWLYFNRYSCSEYRHISVELPMLEWLHSSYKLAVWINGGRRGVNRWRSYTTAK
jgi:hypothetical protein